MQHRYRSGITSRSHFNSAKAVTISPRIDAAFAKKFHGFAGLNLRDAAAIRPPMRSFPTRDF